VGSPASLSVLWARTFHPAPDNNPEVTPLYLSVYDLQTPAFALQCNVVGDCTVSCTVIPVAESEVQFRNRANHTATGRTSRSMASFFFAEYPVALLGWVYLGMNDAST
jgi:hypothetical protein